MRGAAAAMLAALLAGCRREPPPAGPKPAGPEPLIAHQAGVFERYAGSASCQACHAAEYAEWRASNHGLAERNLDPARDRAAFDPARTAGTGQQASRVEWAEGAPIVEAPAVSGRERHPVVRAIGNDPLIQFLVSAPGGRLQATELAWDPHRSEWFNVFGAEDRRPGEWGHWTGRGMTWNTMCAACHNTRLRKNYDPIGDTFRTAMAEATVGCESCHGPMQAHVRFRGVNPDPSVFDPTLKALDRDQVTETCASCHARRTEITGDMHPGERFLDHHLLTVPDFSDLYYADGQVRDELYEYGSFHGSRMHDAGVRCLDCHNPHAARLKLEGDATCMQCHAAGVNTATGGRAPVIRPDAHTFHRPDGAGARCVACHMPVTRYMQRDPRHDHSFTVPDPLLTREFGIPNACNRCHADQTADWALGHVEQWYGARMNRPARERARLTARARAGDPLARPALLTALQTETNAYWRASAVRLLEQWLAEPAALSAVASRTRDPHPLVRAHAAQTLASAAQNRAPGARTALETLLHDDTRAVRVAAAWGLRDVVPADALAARELAWSLEHNADQPAGRMQRAGWRFARGDAAGGLDDMRVAVGWDGNSPALRHDYAVALSAAGRSQEALAEMRRAAELDPGNADTLHALALAWHEVGNLDNALACLEQVTRLNPRHARAWYNLGLARSARGDDAGALEALRRGEDAGARDAAIPYAAATVHARLGKLDEARDACRRALALEPGHAEATRLLEQLSRRGAGG